MGKFYYQTKRANTFAAYALLSKKGRLLAGDLRRNYTHNKFNLSINYANIDQVIDNCLSEGLITMNFTTAYNLSDDFQLNAGNQYDLNNSKKAYTLLWIKRLGSFERL